MGLWQRIWGAPAAQTSGTADPAGWLTDLFGGVMTSSGLRVGVGDALRLPGVAASIQVLSEDLAKVPLVLYRKKPGGGKEPATDHPLFNLLHNHPAPWLPAMQWRRTLVHNAMSRGNAFCRVHRTETGDVRMITPIQPGGATVRWTTEGEPFYDVMAGTTSLVGLSYQDVIHVPYRASNDGAAYGGVWGRSPLEMHRESLALAVAAEKFAGHFFANGARPSFVLETEKTLPDDKVAARMRASVERAFGGLDNAFKVAILEFGMKLREVQINNADSQLIEVRKQQAAEQATMFNMPQHKIGIMDRATFSNIEHQAIEYVTGPVSSMASAIEAAISTTCLTDAEREEYEVRHDLDELQRGDVHSRYRAYAIGRQWGWLSADDIREWEDLNPLPDGQGKAYLTPLNMVPAGTDPLEDDEDRRQNRQSSLVGADGRPLNLPN